MNLIVNAGSGTIKYRFFEEGVLVFRALYEKTGNTFHLSKGKSRQGKPVKIRKKDYDNSLVDLLSNPTVQSLLLRSPLASIGFRVVHGGAMFSKSTRLTFSALKKLKQLDELAPLHNPYARILIEQSEKVFPGVKKVLFFDTSFHQTIPEVNSRYAIPHKYTKGQVKRYGFHGIVCSSLVHQLREKNKLKERLVICHLGSGCSVTAVLNGESVDTSMGFTPLEGLVMSSRAGDIDPGALLYIQKKNKLSSSQLENILNHESGLKALARTTDMRDILKRVKKKDKIAKLALEIFCSKVAKYVAACTVSLGGIDQIVFSGGIGENASLVREKVCDYLKTLGVRLNTEKNKTAKTNQLLKRRFSKIDISWMHADEEAEMNYQLIELNN